MTNYTRDMTDEERRMHCFVQHADAGGRCEEPASKVVYGLYFCEAHGAEAEAGALLEAYTDASYFFERLNNPHVPGFNSIVDRELAALAERLTDAAFSDAAHHVALMHAYPSVPEGRREQIDSWKRDEDPYPEAVETALLDALTTTHKLMRLAYEEGETPLLETLEQEREGLAAHAAYAMRELSPQS